MTFRIISRLDIKDDKLVKGINLEGLRILGDPIEYAEHYYEQNIDEIILQEVVASLYNRNNLSILIKKLAKKIFIPLSVGGGIRNLSDIEASLTNGADKVCINTAAFKNKNFIKDAVKEFGSSTITISIEVLKVDNKFFTFTNNGRTPTDTSLIDWINFVQEEGAGEIILTSITNEGLRKGFDVDLLDCVDRQIKIPYLIHGGAGSLENILDVKKNYMTSGVILSSMLHYKIFNQISDSLWNNDFLKKNNYFSVMEIKNFLKSKNIEINI